MRPVILIASVNVWIAVPKTFSTLSCASDGYSSMVTSQEWPGLAQMLVCKGRPARAHYSTLAATPFSWLNRYAQSSCVAWLLYSLLWSSWSPSCQCMLPSSSPTSSDSMRVGKDVAARVMNAFDYLPARFFQLGVCTLTSPVATMHHPKLTRSKYGSSKGLKYFRLYLLSRTLTLYSIWWHESYRLLWWFHTQRELLFKTWLSSAAETASPIMSTYK